MDETYHCLGKLGEVDREEACVHMGEMERVLRRRRKEEQGGVEDGDDDSLTY